jgi:hypothetical protein
MLQPNNETNDLDDWEKYAEREDEEKYTEREDEENTEFPVKKQSIEEKELKEEIERTNQQTVNDLFKVNSSADKLSSIKNDNTNAPINAPTNATNSNAIKTKSDYINYGKECSNKLKSNKATSLSILNFCKTIVDENCLRISAEHLEDLLEHIHKLKESKLFKPINKPDQLKIQKQSQQNHKDIFGDCTEEFDEEYLRMESNYARGGRH